MEAACITVYPVIELLPAEAVPPETVVELSRGDPRSVSYTHLDVYKRQLREQ